jgi:hypothetical protein
MTDYHAIFVALFRQIEPQLSQKSSDVIANFLDHHENSLALEAMVIELCRLGKVPNSLDHEKIRGWMHEMEIDTEPALEEGIYERFMALPSR